MNKTPMVVMIARNDEKGLWYIFLIFSYAFLIGKQIEKLEHFFNYSCAYEDILSLVIKIL